MSDERQIAVLGGGGHAKVVVATLLAAGEPVGAVFDDRPQRSGAELLGVPVVGPVDTVRDRGFRRAVLAIGDNATRHRLASELSLEWARAVHPRALVHASARLGPGTVVFAGAVLQPDVLIGAHAIVNTGASIDHDCVLGNCVHVGPGVRLAGGVKVGDGALIGIGASVIPGVTIGAGALVGAGAAVVADVAAGATVAGVPARPLGEP